MKPLLVIWSIIIYLLPSVVLAQIPDEKSLNFQDSVLNQNRLEARSNHSGNTYFWGGKVYYNFLSDDINFHIDEQFNTTVIKSNQKYIQDIQNLNFNIKYKILEDFNYKFQVNSIVFADDRSIGINNASIHSLLNGLEYEPFKDIFFSALGGWKFDNQIGIKDAGFSYLLNSRMKNFISGDQHTELNFDLEGDLLDPRENADRKVFFMFQKDFSQKAFDNFGFYYRDFKKDFYIPVDSILAGIFNIEMNIDRREENILLFNNELSYILSDYFVVSFNTSVFNRNIFKSTKYKNPSTFFGNPFDLKINEFKIDGVAQIKLDLGFFKSIFKIGLNERDEKHSLDNFEGVSSNYYQSKLKSETSKDNISKSNYISLNNIYRFSDKDELQLSGLVNIFRYDTPSDQNYDDRDELQTAINISEIHRFNEFIYAKTNLDLSNLHTVFLFGERSANNSINKIIRLQEQVDYSISGSFRTSNIFEVLANYTVYDFEEKVTSYKSLVFRQFGWLDSTSIDLSRKIGLDLFTYIKLYERGELKWKDFKEAPIEYLTDQSYQLQLRYSMGINSYFAFGYKLFFQNRYRYNNLEKELYLTQKSEGPTFKISVLIENRLNLECDGWYERFYQGEMITRRISNFNINLSWYY